MCGTVSLTNMCNSIEDGEGQGRVEVRSIMEPVRRACRGAQDGNVEVSPPKT